MKTAVAAIEKTEEFFRSLHMSTCLGDMKMGVQPDEVLKEMAGKATAGDTMKVGAFQKMGAFQKWGKKSYMRFIKRQTTDNLNIDWHAFYRNVFALIIPMAPRIDQRRSDCS